jgi:glycosyltransferase involved in cell wall biosynthesis
MPIKRASAKAKSDNVFGQAPRPGAKDCLAPVNSDTPSLSVIIPAFDEERYLPATLQAVENSALLLRSRDGVNTEVIVVDNNSADATAKVARSFGARVVAESEHNIALVRNCGAATAQGRVLVFIDADTHIPAGLLQRIHQVFAAPGYVGGAVDTEYRPKKRSVSVYFSPMADAWQGRWYGTRGNAILPSGHFHRTWRL